MRVSVAARLVALALAGVATVGWVAATSYSVSRSQADSARQMARLGAATSAQWNADMMHDALRADVLGAIGAVSSAERESLAVTEVARHGATMVDRLDAAQAGAPASLQADYRAVRPKVVAYAKLAEELVDLAAGDRAAAHARLPEFMTAFGALEGSLGSIDDRVESALLAVQKQSDGAARRSTVLIVVVSVTGAALLAGLSLVIVRGVVTSVGHIRARLAEVAGGDFRVRADTGRQDELGDLARAVDATVASVREAFTGIDAVADDLTENAEGLRAASGELSRAAQQTSQLAATSVVMAEHVADGAERVGRGIGTVTDQTAEIAGSAAHVGEVGRQAVDGAAVAAAAVTRLGEAGAQISGVAAMIRSISDQTRLLALNATIEAARAGEAGRGFAVVAGEVKDLAQEVGQATEDISGRIAAIHTEVAEAVESIRAVTEVIAEINLQQDHIAAAVERQTGTSREVGELVGGAARDAAGIARQVTSISAAAEQTSATASVALESADRLTQAATRMRSTLQRYSY